MPSIKPAIPFIVSLLLLSCTKDSFTTSKGALIRTSTDSLKFDTVFTTTGSATRSFKIINEDTKSVHITAVQLSGGTASPFKINVDGTPGPRVGAVDIAADDSLYVFVTVKIDPAAANLPFVVQDSIELSYNGTFKKIGLEAWGQNAHFLRNRIVRGAETWKADLPYVILGGLTIDTAAVLTLSKGVRIYAHADAPVLVQGTLQAAGEKWDSTRVVFSGDRLDEPYNDYPAGWPGIIFSGTSRNNSLTYTTVRNAYQALVVQGPVTGAAPQLSLSQTIIDNAYDAGLAANNSYIAAQNLLVSNCGKGIVLSNGGVYTFTHCTAVGFSNSLVQHKHPVLFISNYLTAPGQANSLTAAFRNCIFWGDDNGAVKEEVAIAQGGTTNFSLSFNQVLWRVGVNPANTGVSGAITADPRFDSINTAKRVYSFRLKEGSPAVNKGTSTGVLIDLDGNVRPAALLPDLGAYERQ